MEAKKTRVQLLLSIPQCLSQFSILITIMGISVPDVQLLTKGKEDLSRRLMSRSACHFVAFRVVLEYALCFSNACPSACFVLELHRSLVSPLVLVCRGLLRTLVLCSFAACSRVYPSEFSLSLAVLHASPE